MPRNHFTYLLLPFERPLPLLPPPPSVPHARCCRPGEQFVGQFHSLYGRVVAPAGGSDALRLALLTGLKDDSQVVVTGIEPQPSVGHARAVADTDPWATHQDASVVRSRTFVGRMKVHLGWPQGVRPEHSAAAPLSHGGCSSCSGSGGGAGGPWISIDRDNVLSNAESRGVNEWLFQKSSEDVRSCAAFQVRLASVVAL